MNIIIPQSATTENSLSVHSPAISIIVPIYNTEPYLSQCIDSIITQSFADYELLLINDGSSDSSGAICEKYAASDSRILVIHKENGGPSSARNLGLDRSSGDYIAMIDSDDLLLSSDYLQIMYDAANELDADLVICGHACFRPNEPAPQAYGNGKVIGILNGVEFNSQNYSPMEYIHNCSHGKLYRRELFNGIRYPEGRIFEDVSIQHRLTFHCKRIAFIDKHMYGYRVRNDGLEQGTSQDIRIRDVLQAVQDRMDYFNSLGYTHLAKKEEQGLLHWLKKQKENER